MSLKIKIKEHLKSYKKMSLNELEQFCKNEHKKLSNAERLLRNLRSKMVLGKINENYCPQVGVITNGKGAIIGYTWNENQINTSPTFDVEKWNAQFYTKPEKKEEPVGQQLF